MREFDNFASLLKAKRQERGLTQLELSEKLGGAVHPQFVSNWERGLCAPPDHCLDKVIEVLKIKKEAVVEAMLADAKLAIEARIFKRRKSG